MAYHWIKVLHLTMVMSWMAGIFYLPRIYVHLQEGRKAGEDVRRLLIMARKLYKFMTIIAILAVGSGLWLMFDYGMSKMPWLHAKIAVVGLLVGYHVLCRWILARAEQDTFTWSPRSLRWLNELPLLLLVPILYLAVAKPAFG